VRASKRTMMNTWTVLVEYVMDRGLPARQWLSGCQQ
jgi:hypothetical protein